jgi:hypothetical protein
MEFYIESADRPQKSGVANVAITAGEGVVAGPNGVEPATADSDFDGVATYEPELLAKDESRDGIVPRDETYEADERVPHGGDEDGARVRLRTIEDESAPAPAIGHQTTVGFIDPSSTDAPADSAGRIVEEGYTADADGDGATTTFNEANGNFAPVGEALRPAQQAGETVTEYDYPVRVEVDS